MFCLFRNSQIEPRLNRYVILLSLAGVAGWLYFSFIEKSLVGKVFEGKALLVDLVFGLPLVLMLAVVVYATIYWASKILIMLLMPQAIIMKAEDSQQLNDELVEEEEVHGEGYWNESEPDNSDSKSDQISSDKPDNTPKKPD